MAQFCRPLHNLVPLRKRIIKRPVLTTVEVLAKPICGKVSTHLMTGYVHKPYPPVYERLAKLAGYDSAVLVRGVEGGVTPALNKPAKYFEYHGLQGELTEIDVAASEANIEQSVRCVPLPDEVMQTDANGEAIVNVEQLSKASAQAGMEALDGKQGPARDCLSYSAAIVLKHLGHAQSLAQGSEIVAQAIASGKAMKMFSN